MIDLEKEHLEAIKAILESQIPDVEVWMFGSRVQGKAKRYSDVDLVLITGKSLPLEKIWALEEAFSNSDMPFRVDLVDWCGISGELKEIIIKNHEKLVIPSGGSPALS